MSENISNAPNVLINENQELLEKAEKEIERLEEEKKDIENALVYAYERFYKYFINILKK